MITKGVINLKNIFLWIVAIIVVPIFVVTVLAFRPVKETLQTNNVAVQLEDSNADIIYKKLNRL